MSSGSSGTTSSIFFLQASDWEAQERTRRQEAQRTAAESGDPGEIREAKHLRNRVVDSRRTDRKVWEQEKLSSNKRNPADVWKGVKSVLGWGDAGPPSRLYHEGKFINTPKGLATTMNQYFWTKVDKLRRIKIRSDTPKTVLNILLFYFKVISIHCLTF